ncbi:hypothetical protein PSTT_08597 [Puccinia striiformis]|uniref:Peptidase A2 domain-containing protein n=1 Tax=Puccinia striiformis TaxID=27350 RepID=A0A2S4VBX2_9BASI|nr:hypothetical protein PSTT_08597 [Puccinia striiformis]
MKLLDQQVTAIISPRRTATRPKGVLTSGVPTVADNFQKINAKSPAATKQQETVVKTNPGRIKKDEIWHNVSLTEQEQEFLSEYVDGFPRTEKDLDKTVPEGSESVADIYSKMANSEDSRTDKEIIQDQNETISKLIQEMKEFKDSYQEMSRMFKEHSVAPQNVPIPATPNPRVIPSLRFATSTPRGERTYAMDTTIGAGDQSFVGTEVPSPDAEQSSPRPEIKLIEESTGVILDVKKTNLYFDGTDVELFLKRVEKTAKIHGAGAPDVAEQLPFILNNRKISEAMEQMEGHETANWELFKKELIRKWGRATPLRRYKEDAIPRLIQKTQENQGIKNHTEYKKFVGELEEMIDYFVRMGYSHLNPESEMLKEYIEISLIIVDFEDDLQEEALKKEPAKKSVKIKEPADQEDAKETVKKLTAALDYQQRGAPPHLSRPSSPGLSEARARYTPLECFYCGGKHGVNTCDFFGPDLQERRVLRYQGMYHYPNRQPIVVENGMSVREMVQRYHDEQEKLSRAKDPAPEPTAGIAALDEWGSWVPPQANIDEDDLQTNIGFGLRKSQRIQEKNPPSGSQTIPNKPQEPVSKTPPPNQEALKSTTRRKSFPGSWMEEDTVEEEESSGRCTKDSVPPLEKGKQASQTPTGTKEDAGGRLDKSIRNKFYKQTYTLTLEEIVKIAPQFLKGLQESLLNEEGPGKGANSGKLNCSAGFGEPDSDEEAGLTYACPVGMIDMTINDRKIRTLVDTGAEMNIIPDTLADQLGLVTTEIFMRLKGIGGHFTPITGLAENVPISVLPGYSHLANFFIVKGSVHTVLGRPFLADHNIRLELSNQKGEVLSFPAAEGRRICIPICLPSTPGWHKDPQPSDKIVPSKYLNWESFEQLENFEEPSILQDGKESPIRGQSEKIARDDPWKVYISEPVDWVNELGGFKFTLEEQTKIDAEEEELAKMWGSAVDDKDTGVGYYWLELHIPSRFKDVFDETNRPKRERKAQIWLRELPGGFSNSLASCKS